ncbi:RNA ligase/cyclic nucleotide phosphodiesterase, U6 snRNA phosphodiesterase Usb1 [Artemisia annua]|uniref:RNA ligase/cyclic nucleotide phosphodiesterase, U6 snRNA phosphodiesterase Usb1 n=1 Tax=Artemisia annua TaxID=35608 RepID=A0A2U1LYQ9_ARTAN|nr:RNA ligase/cyclic nucleotide phosphodiesterase, U6 snRNA phosphodiesterase Usb1 [Artemisia annua]
MQAENTSQSLTEVTKQAQVVNEVFKLHNLPEFYKVLITLGSGPWDQLFGEGAQLSSFYCNSSCSHCYSTVQACFLCTQDSLQLGRGQDRVLLFYGRRRVLEGHNKDASSLGEDRVFETLLLVVLTNSS